MLRQRYLLLLLLLFCCSWWWCCLYCYCCCCCYRSKRCQFNGMHIQTESSLSKRTITAQHTITFTLHFLLLLLLLLPSTPLMLLLLLLSFSFSSSSSSPPSSSSLSCSTWLRNTTIHWYMRPTQYIQFAANIYGMKLYSCYYVDCYCGTTVQLLEIKSSFSPTTNLWMDAIEEARASKQASNGKRDDFMLLL